jgi:hypothetical protein
MTLLYAKPARKILLSAEHPPTLRYEFAPDDPLAKGEYRVAGGLAWPGPSGEFMGLALILGLSTRTGIAHVLAEHPFALIEPMAQDGDEIAPYPYLADFINQARADYGCDTFCWSGDTLKEEPFVWRLMRSDTVEPKPRLPRIDWLDEERAAGLWFQWEQSGRLVGLDAAEGGLTHRAMLEYASLREMTPPLWALSSALAGLELAGADRAPRKDEPGREGPRKRPSLDLSGLI